MTTNPEAGAGRPLTLRRQATFWVLVVLFVLLIAGSIDVASRLWSRGDVSISAGVGFTAGLMAGWLLRCLRGWARARRGDDAGVVSDGGIAWTVVVILLVVANVAAAVVLGSIAADGGVATNGRAAAAVDILTVASNAWVLLYYRVPRRWDGRRV